MSSAEIERLFCAPLGEQPAATADLLLCPVADLFLSVERVRKQALFSSSRLSGSCCFGKRAEAEKRRLPGRCPGLEPGRRLSIQPDAATPAIANVDGRATGQERPLVSAKLAGPAR